MFTFISTTFKLKLVYFHRKQSVSREFDHSNFSFPQFRILFKETKGIELELNLITLEHLIFVYKKHIDKTRSVP